MDEELMPVIVKPVAPVSFSRKLLSFFPGFCKYCGKRMVMVTKLKLSPDEIWRLADVIGSDKLSQDYIKEILSRSLPF